LRRRRGSRRLSRYDGWFLRKDICQDGQEVQYARFLVGRFVSPQLARRKAWTLPSISHPKTPTSRPGMDGTPGPEDRRAVPAVPPCSRSGSRRPEVLLGDTHAEPIAIWETDMWCLGRAPGSSRTDGREEPRRHWGKL